MAFIIDIDNDGDPELNEHEARRMLGKAGNFLKDLGTGSREIAKGVANKRRAKKEVEAKKPQARTAVKDPDIERIMKDKERIRRSHLVTAGRSIAHKKAYQKLMSEDLENPDHPDFGRFVEEIVDSRVETQIIDDIGVASKKRSEPTIKPRVRKRKSAELCR